MQDKTIDATFWVCNLRKPGFNPFIIIISWNVINLFI